MCSGLVVTVFSLCLVAVFDPEGDRDTSQRPVMEEGRGVEGTLNQVRQDRSCMTHIDSRQLETLGGLFLHEFRIYIHIGKREFNFDVRLQEHIHFQYVYILHFLCCVFHFPLLSVLYFFKRQISM